MTDLLEKIKIAVPESIIKIINRDAESFEFRKKDNSLNKNLFINTLILNYFETFSKREKEEKESLLKEASNSGLDITQIDSFINKIVKRSSRDYKKKDQYSFYISFRPTKKSSYVIDYIENNLLLESTLSDYFRRLFYSYSALPQYQREKILFKEQYEKALEAIKNNKQVYVSTKNNLGNRTLMSPFAIAAVKEETYNYLLCKDGGYCRAFRLSKIQDCQIADLPVSFTKEDKNQFEKMIKYGPQYFYHSSDTEAEIILTKKGQKLFNSLYVYRPIPDKIEEDHYFFNCSSDQLFQYFSRFGSECYVLKPRKLKNQLIDYYHKSYRNLISFYKSLNK